MTDSPLSSLKAADLREQMLEAVRKENPGLQPEDAFEVPTSFVQQKKWIEDPAGSDSVAFNYPILIRLRGPLDEPALRQSLREIVRRHGVFRSVFRIIDGKLIQIVLPSPEFSWTATELGGPPEAREQHWQEAVRAEALRPFSFEHGPILRARLMRLASDDAVLQLTTHTIVYDDWSTGVLIKELSAFYSAFAGGASLPDGDLPCQFGDFVRWQQRWLQGPDVESHLDYWKRQLDPASSVEHLPADFPRPPRNSNRGARQTAVLSPAQADALKALSRQQRVSLFMVLLAGFQALLHRHSGHEEISVASCVANRPLLEVEGLIGRFGNSTLYRANLAGNPSFVELLQRVREVTLMAACHQEVPFAMVLNRIDAGAGRIRIPPFQSMFILQNAPKEKWQLAGLKVAFVPYEPGTSTYDLIVWLKTEPALQITFEYSTQLFEQATINRFLSDYLAILETIVKNPAERVSNIHVSTKPAPGCREPVSMPARQGYGPGDEAGVESRMIELWEEILGVRPIEAIQDYFGLGGDSLRAVRLMGRINEVFRSQLPVSVLLEAPTPRKLAQLLCRPQSDAVSVLVAVQPKGARPPLFCVHGHGGEPVYSAELSRRLGPNQPIYGLRSLGHCGGAVHDTIPEMAAHYVRAVRTVAPRGPYYLGGYCVGGMIAYEMARVLRAQGEEIALLALFNTPSPGSLKGWPLNLQYLKNRTSHELGRLRSRPAAGILRILGVKSLHLCEHVLGVSKTTLSSRLANSSATKMNAWAQGFVRVPDANVAAAKSYDPGNYDGRITMFTTKEILDFYRTDPREGWLQYAAGGIEHFAVDGDNDLMFDPMFDTALVEKLKSCLDKAHGQHPSADAA
jgi:thioesterase domain-containing protein/acyl carrier protein